MERFPRRLLVPMIAGTILNPINTSIVAVALVPIGIAFGAPPAQTAWLVSGLYIATSIGQPLTGRLVDVYGPKRMFLLGAALVTVAGILATAAPTLWVLIAARALLGLGTCAAYPASMTLIRRVCDARGLASPAGVLTALTMTVQTVAVVGPTLGGLLIDIGGWRATMAVNIPLGLIALVLGSRLLPDLGHRAEAAAGSDGSGGRGAASGASSGSAHPASAVRVPLDWPGVLCFAVGLTGLLLFLMEPDLGHLWALVPGVLALAGFAWRELRTAEPFIDLRVLGANPALLTTYVRGTTVMVIQYGFIYGFTQWLQQGAGLSPSLVGLVLLPTFGVALLVSAVFGRRPRIRANLLVGGVLQLVVAGSLLLLYPATPVWVYFLITAVLGIPQGLLSLSNQNAMYHQADPATIGAASGLLRTFQYLGAVTASAVSGLVFGARADTPGMHSLAWVMVIVAVLTIVLTAGDRSLARLPRSDGKSK
ncbi:MFS transporter [Brevibacterium sp. 50QC2O2]|uniref:MFS transporter n=1 Tax=Brevibacterium sp. 50QC2O2 TaxID=2968459 RepID=UPI00211BBB80|nr:MFS transporter [Brevibacterium sp. 50QC2O2]MCQ9387088.1 MFS transporter [Brevibacterium sp. 50QC2O2]